MRRLLVFQHVPHEILGTLDPLLRRAGFRIRYVNFGRQPDARPDLARYHGLIVLGGPMNCDQVNRHRHLATEIELIEQALVAGKPVLGICLGAQLLARALGAPVTRNGVPEIGWYDVEPTPAAAVDPLFRHFAPRQRIFQWHGDTFAIPRDAVHLARSPDCENQAFRWGDIAYGLQFHLEVDSAMIERWLHTPVNQNDLERLAGTIDPARISAETPLAIDEATRLAERVFGDFIRLFSLRHRHVALPSR
ncbi:MAG: gamma-glutamyl-gamma-aminobutyrate hydrolase family protein [Chromatiales bacterium]|nr:gamma-glutamyl-gamma-aminobutyrate hydrolase family protein [Chromatiales bacterium]